MNQEPFSAAERERIVVEGYDSGKKLSEIEQEAGVARSTLYWILEKNGRTPNRANRRSRILDDATAESLWELIQHQHERILELEERIEELTHKNAS